MSIFAAYLAGRKPDSSDFESESEAMDTSDNEQAKASKAEGAAEAETSESDSEQAKGSKAEAAAEAASSESSSEPPVLHVNKASV